MEIFDRESCFPRDDDWDICWRETLNKLQICTASEFQSNTTFSTPGLFETVCNNASVVTGKLLNLLT